MICSSFLVTRNVLFPEGSGGLKPNTGSNVRVLNFINYTDVTMKLVR